MSGQDRKKVLFVMGMEQKIEDIVNEFANVDPENILILQSYRPVISPFGDLMRDIIIAVYKEQVEEIIVTAAKTEKKKINLNKLYENKELQEKIQTFDYLFKSCKPEFPEAGILEWLEGSSDFSVELEKSVECIRRHPLIPSYVKVRTLLINNENIKENKLAIF